MIDAYLADAASIERDAAFCSVPQAQREVLRQAARDILASPELLGKLRLIDDAICRDDAAWNASPFLEFPRDGGSAGEAWLLAFPILHHVPEIRALYARRGIPERYLAEAMKDLPRWFQTYADRTRGLPGFAEVAWLREHICARIFQIGRLQFQPGRWGGEYTFLRNRRNGACALLAREGDAVTVEGSYASCRGAPQEGAVPLVYREDAKGFLGHRVGPDGRLARAPELFPAPEWEKFIEKGDPVINIHIPEGPNFTKESCRDAVEAAPRFFRDYFPDWPLAHAKALVCVTWLLSPNFPRLLRPSSNILGFQSLFQLFPVRNMGDDQFYERVFLPYGRAVRRDQLKTSLQFALFDYIAAGHTPLEGGGVIPIPRPNPAG